MSANSVSALAYRAREGLRQAFLNQHAQEIEDDTCQWTHQHLGAYIRNGISRRDAAKVEEHLDECRKCMAIYLELSEVNSNLAGILAPLLLGGAAHGLPRHRRRRWRPRAGSSCWSTGPGRGAANLRPPPSAGVAATAVVVGATFVAITPRRRPAARAPPTSPSGLTSTRGPAPDPGSATAQRDRAGQGRPGPATTPGAGRAVRLARESPSAAPRVAQRARPTPPDPTDPTDRAPPTPPTTAPTTRPATAPTDDPTGLAEPHRRPTDARPNPTDDPTAGPHRRPTGPHRAPPSPTETPPEPPAPRSPRDPPSPQRPTWADAPTSTRWPTARYRVGATVSGTATRGG